MFNRLGSVTLFISIIFITKSGWAQSFDTDYINVVNDRAFKLARELNIGDSTKFYLVRDKIDRQYVNVRILDEKLEKQINEIEAKNATPVLLKTELGSLHNKGEKERKAINVAFVQSLSEELSSQQIDKVKDGLTFGLFHVIYHVFMDMIPSLKKEEEAYIFNSLIEVRDLAMASGSSKLKETLFEACRAKINSYLMARGYDLKLQRKNWYAKRMNQ